MLDRVMVSAVARELGLSWDTDNSIAVGTTQMIVAADTGRLDGVRVIGVDEYHWSHIRGSDGFVSIVVELTAVLAGTGWARLLDMVPGRSAAGIHDVAGGPDCAVPRPGRDGVPFRPRWLRST